MDLTFSKTQEFKITIIGYLSKVEEDFPKSINKFSEGPMVIHLLQANGDLPKLSDM